METNLSLSRWTFKKNINLDETSAKPSLSSIYTDRNNRDIHELNLFLVYFNTIPNIIPEVDIDCKKANEIFKETYQSEIIESNYTKRYFKEKKKVDFDDIFYILYEDLIVDFDTNNSVVRFLFKETDISKIDKIISLIKNCKVKKDRFKPEISLLLGTSRGYDTKSMPITKPKLNLVDNYNNDFKDVHSIILKRLRKKNDKGIVLLHGKPGTGKTSYIRYLVSLVKKNVIFLPPNMASAITNPDFLSFLVDNRNSIFVIEDAENIVVDRENNGSSPVSGLLNISDGLLSDCLNIQIICSFNTDISKIDNALMRKGRLIAKYEFKELEIEKAQVLSSRLGFKTTISTPMSLTSIYNQDEKDFNQHSKKKKIGF